MTSFSMHTVPVGFDLWLEIEDRRYALAKAAITFSAGNITAAEASLAVGRRGDRTGARGGDWGRHARGTPAKLVFRIHDDAVDPIGGAKMLTGGSYEIDMYVDFSGPGNLQRGSFNVRVGLVSRLALLQAGSLQLSRLVPRTCFDTTQVLPYLDKKTGAVGGLPVKATDLTPDFWKGLAKVLTGMTEINAQPTGLPVDVTKYFALFGKDANVPARELLATIDGGLTFRSDIAANSQVIGSFASFLTALFSTDWRLESFLARINNLGLEFKFRLLETFAGRTIVPYSPFFPADHAKVIAPSTVTDIDWSQGEPTSVLGTVMTAGGPSLLDAKTREKSYIVGMYKRPTKATALGTVLPFTAPPWMCLDPGNPQSKGLPVDTIRTLFGDRYAREACLELAYSRMIVQTSGPLRMDIAPLTPVQLVYPRLSDIGAPSSIYGSVQMVKLVADAVSKSAATILEVGYARTPELQADELADYQHPLWSEQYRGGTLVD